MSTDETTSVLTTVTDKPCYNAVVYLFQFQRPNPTQVRNQYEVLEEVGDSMSDWVLSDKVPLQMAAPAQKTEVQAEVLETTTSDKSSQINLAAVLNVDPGKVNVCRIVDFLLQGLIELRFESWDKIENGHHTNQVTGRLLWAKHYGPKLSTRIYNTDKKKGDPVFRTAKAKQDYKHFAECFRHVVDTLAKSYHLRNLDIDISFRSAEGRQTIFAEIESLFFGALEPIHVLFEVLTVSFSGFVPNDISKVVGKSSTSDLAPKMRSLFYNHVLNGFSQYDETKKLDWKLYWKKSTYIFPKQYKKELAMAARKKSAKPKKKTVTGTTPLSARPTTAPVSGEITL